MVLAGAPRGLGRAEVESLEARGELAGEVSVEEEEALRDFLGFLDSEKEKKRKEKKRKEKKRKKREKRGRIKIDRLSKVKAKGG